MPMSRKRWIVVAAAGLFVGLGLTGYAVTEHVYDPFGVEPVMAPPSPLVSRLAPEELPPPEGVDVSAVRVGQRYHFRGLEAGVITVWEVTAVEHDAIAYERIRLQGERETREGTFLFPRVAPPAQPSLERVGDERLEGEGAAFECEIYRAAQVQSWSSPSFPGTIRTQAGERVLHELVKVEQS